VKPALIAITLGLLLAGCPRTPITLKTVILSPPQINGSYQFGTRKMRGAACLSLAKVVPEWAGAGTARPSEIYSGSRIFMTKVPTFPM